MTHRRPLALALAAGLFVLTARAQDPQPGLAGTWEGHVAFTNGHRARVELTLEPQGATYTGTYALTVLDEHGTNAPITGDLAATTDDGTIRLETDGPLDGAALGRLGDPGHHAERALYGTFTAEAGEGTFILWRYRP